MESNFHENLPADDEYNINVTVYNNKGEFKKDSKVNKMVPDPTVIVNYRSEVVWRNVIKLALLHIAAIYGFYLFLTKAKWATLSWVFFLYLFGGFGITGGAHRLWSHRSYKAKWPLRLLASVAQTVAGQNDIYEWARDHRVHHKFSETDADPHNAKRGFFFAHIGWLMCKKHPEVIRCGKLVNCSDLLKDPIVYYQRKFYIPLFLIFNYALPAFIPFYYWGESYYTSFFVASIFRYVLILHATWMVNSVAHLWSSQHPYDKNINPGESLPVALAALGEGWHNYHHVFPWDYKTAELGDYAVNLTALVIDFFAWTGLAYDLRTVPKNVVHNRINRTGDGSHPNQYIRQH